MYIEVIGDSISTGMGSTGVFNPGAPVKVSDTSASQSYGYFVAQDLGADYSIVAKGGIGVLQGEAAQGMNMPQVYEYLWRFSREDPYAFTRTPDLIILELGANDSPEHKVTTALYKEEIRSFVLRFGNSTERTQ